MKRLTLEATDENILNSIKLNTYNRVSDVCDFIEALDTIEGNIFISLDARWGEGKTFYVRQIEKTLEFLTKRKWDDKNEEVINMIPFFQNTLLSLVDIKKSYFPIYYNAWLYDNHDDPLMSLLFTIVKKWEQYIDTTMNDSIKEKFSKLLSTISVSLSFKMFQVSFDGEKAADALKQEDILKNIKTAEEIRELVKTILNEIIVERAEKMVIFVDELDRCRPTYAIEMLERIKHFFDDERIIFVVSVNKEQLIHTISKYYGNGFDSTGYLSKFFDYNVYMPVMTKNNLFSTHSNNQFLLTSIANGLSEYYKLTLREELVFKQRIVDLPNTKVNDNNAQGCCLSLFIPIIAVLDLKDENLKNRFLQGDTELFKEIISNVPAIKKLISKFDENGNTNEYTNGMKKFIDVFEYTFKDINNGRYVNLILDISIDIKKDCMKLCNGFV